MRHYLQLLILPLLAFGCVFWAPKGWEKTPETIRSAQVEIKSTLDAANTSVTEMDSVIAVQRSLVEAQQKAATWQQSQIEYLKRQYGRPPMR